MIEQTPKQFINHPSEGTTRQAWLWPTGRPGPHSKALGWVRRIQMLKRLWSRPWRRLETKSAVEWRWPDFTAAEMGCRHCGETFDWPDFMDALQAARNRVERPFRILSAHRCSLHNARVGGAPRSQHLRLAVDIALHGHDPTALHRTLREAGFTGFGFYTTFIHADMGRKRHWFGNQTARQTWQIS